MEKQSQFGLIAIVAMVAIVGVVALALNSGGGFKSRAQSAPSAELSADQPIVQVDEQGNVVGFGLRALTPDAYDCMRSNMRAGSSGREAYDNCFHTLSHKWAD